MMEQRNKKFRKPPACTQCRRRKIGCDRVRPVCGNCMRTHKNDCFYPDTHGQIFDEPSIQTTSIKTHMPTIKSYPTQPYQKFSVNTYRSTRQSSNGANGADSNSMEQIGKFNTRLQLLNSNSSNNNGLFNPSDTLQFNASNSTNYNNDIYYTQQPAFFDLMTSVYSQEEVLLKEMDFLKSKFLELQAYRKKHYTTTSNTNVPNSNKRSRTDYEDVENNELPENNKSVEQINIGNNQVSPSHEVEEYDEEDSEDEYLDYTQVFSVIEMKDRTVSTNNGNTILIHDTPNMIFNLNSLIIRDDYLIKFYSDLERLIDTKFKEQLPQIKLEKYRDFKIAHLRFPQLDIVKNSVKFINGNLNLFEEIMSIIDFGHLLTKIDPLFSTADVNSLQVNSLDLNSLSIYGTVTICILIYLAAMETSGVAGEKKITNLSALSSKIEANLLCIMFEIQQRKSLTGNIEVLKFISFFKFYQNNYISVNEEVINNDIGLDEDVYLAYKNSLNLEQENVGMIKIWNFIAKNYYFRKLFNGEIPQLISKAEVKDMVVKDSLVSSDIELLQKEQKFVDYLQSKNKLISTKKVNVFITELEREYKLRVNNSNNIKNKTNMINNIINSQIYYNMNIFVHYYLLLQYEMNKNYAKFNKKLTKLFNFFEIALINQLANINIDNGDIKMHEFMLVGRSMIIIDNIFHMLYAIHQRFIRMYETKNTSQQGPNNELEELKESLKSTSLHIKEIMIKINIIVQEYNAKNNHDKRAINLINKMNVLLKDITNNENMIFQTNNISAEQQHLSQVNRIENGLDKLTNDQIRTHRSFIKRFSHRVMNTNEYNAKKDLTTEYLAQPDPERSFGIDLNNFKQVYTSFFHV